MKKFVHPDSLDSFISIASSKEEQPSCSNICGYSKEFQAMLDSLEQEDNSEDGGPIPERKRRLRLDQVKALETHFEVENKLEPDRKMKIAAELDLEPRQVTIWFQNRRARWKTKQLEREYGFLKVNYDALKLDYDILEKENASLASKLRELREKLCTVDAETKSCEFVRNGEETEIKIHGNLIDGSSESDSNGILNEAREGINSSCFQLSNAIDISSKLYENESQFMKTTEETGFFSTEEPCNFCSVDQAPSLPW